MLLILLDSIKVEKNLVTQATLNQNEKRVKDK